MNSVMPEFSVVTVVLNDHAGLLRTGESILGQTCDLEWIVVDGGSSDATLAVLHGFGDKVRWISEKDNGIFDAMNKGCRMCNGDYVVFLNAGDCFSDSGVLADVRAFLSGNRGATIDVLCCGANLVLADGKRVYRPPKMVGEYIWHGLPANHQATYYRRGMLGTEPYDIRYRYCGDYFLAAILYAKNATFGYLNRQAVEFRLDGVSFNWRSALFMEPYAIQREVLLLGFGWRILSLLKRFMAGAALRLFNLPLLGNMLFRVFTYIRSRKIMHKETGF